MKTNNLIMKTIGCDTASPSSSSERGRREGFAQERCGLQSSLKLSTSALLTAAVAAFFIGWTAAPQFAQALPPAAESGEQLPPAGDVESTSSSASSAESSANGAGEPAPDQSQSESPPANLAGGLDSPEIVIDNDDDLRIDNDLDVSPRIIIHNLENRPPWVGGTPVRNGDIHTTAVRSGPYHLQRDAQRALNEELQKAVNDYIDEWLGVKDAHQLLSYDLAYINSHLRQPIGDSSSQNQYDEVAEHPLPVGLMHESHALLAFEDSFRNELNARWAHIIAGKRLVQTGLSAFGVLGLLGVIFGYFKLDTATRGFYTARLQFLAAAAILALVAAGVLMAKWVPYM